MMRNLKKDVNRIMKASLAGGCVCRVLIPFPSEILLLK